MPKRLAYRSIDDCLGPAHGRFFGTGYRRARYRIRDVTVVPPDLSESPGVTASVSVAYPPDWSRKGGGANLTPHLSTIDTLLLAAQLGEAYLAGALGLDEERRRRARLRQVILNAGTAPQEELSDIPARVVPVGCEPVTDRGAVLTTFDCRIGLMRARCQVEHASTRPGDQGTTVTRYDGLAALLAPAEQRYYGEAFRHRQVEITGVGVDTVDGTAAATVRIRTDGGVSADAGLDGVYQPTPSMVEAFVTGLQLVQALMYAIDDIPRECSDTLWMRSTVLRSAPVPVPLDGPMPARFSCPGRRLLTLGGETWRNVDVAGDIGGVSLRSSVAHRLPARPVADRVHHYAKTPEAQL